MDAIDLDTRIAEARARLSQRELDAKAAAAAQWTEQMNAAMNAAAAQYHPHLDGDLDEALRAAWAFRWHVERDTRSDRGGVPVVRGFDLTLDGEAVHVALSKDWTAYYWSVSPSGESTKRVEVGTLADTLGGWLAECCVVSATATTKSAEALASYRAHSGSDISPHRFGALLRERGFASGTDGKARFWRGFGLLAPSYSGEEL